MTPALEVRGLDVPFGDGPGLSGVEFSVEAGGRLGIVGPSGAGKTSLLRALAGSGRITAGSIRVHGEEVSHLPAARRGAVLLSQRPLLFPHLSVFENVAFPLRVRGVRGRALGVRVDRALEAVRLGDLASRAPVALSGGQAHRVALARAVVSRPRVLLLDEPLSSLDPALREDVRRSMMEVQAEFGPAMLLVTHDLGEAGRSAEELAVLLDGRIAQMGVPARVFRSPDTLAVARFLGLPNELPGVRGPDALVVAGWPQDGGPSPVGPGDGERACPGRAPAASGSGGGKAVRIVFGFDAVTLTTAGRGIPAEVVEVHHAPRGVTAEVRVLAGPGPLPGAGEGPWRCQVARIPCPAPGPGDRGVLTLDPSRLHIYPAEDSA